MPTPVSCFSPFTPFTPATSAHGSGGYFDRPTPMNGVSPLSRRPALCNNGYSSSNSTRLSRPPSSIESPRLPAENGWRMATRMREEAFTAWEQQVKNTNSNNIVLLRDPRQLYTRQNPVHTQHGSDKTVDKSSTASSDCTQQSTFPSRPSLRLALHSSDSRFNSEGANMKTLPVKSQQTSLSFDPLSFRCNRGNLTTYAMEGQRPCPLNQ